MSNVKYPILTVTGLSLKCPWSSSWIIRRRQQTFPFFSICIAPWRWRRRSTKWSSSSHISVTLLRCTSVSALTFALAETCINAEANVKIVQYSTNATFYNVEMINKVKMKDTFKRQPQAQNLHTCDQEKNYSKDNLHACRINFEGHFVLSRVPEWTMDYVSMSLSAGHQVLWWLQRQE